MDTTTPHIRSLAPPRITIRPLARADRNALARALTRLSEETRRRRFGGLASQLSEHELEQLTNIDDHDHEALAAVGADQIVGIARYIALPSDPGAAEVAVAGDDEWQSRGIGRTLDRARRRSRRHARRRAAVYSIPLDGFTEERMAA
jgi:GNAT superfamily N-acetyltransferase